MCACVCVRLCVWFHFRISNTQLSGDFICICVLNRKDGVSPYLMRTRFYMCVRASFQFIGFQTCMGVQPCTLAQYHKGHAPKPNSLSHFFSLSLSLPHSLLSLYVSVSLTGAQTCLVQSIALGFPCFPPQMNLCLIVPL